MFLNSFYELKFFCISALLFEGIDFKDIDVFSWNFYDLIKYSAMSEVVIPKEVCEFWNYKETSEWSVMY